MPTGQPTIEQLWNGEITFFSIDTDLIQSAGYRFREGALHHLPRLIPVTMQLQLTEVVAQEVINHLLQPVKLAAKEITSASASLQRLAKIDMHDVDSSFQSLSVEAAAREHFRREIEEFAERCRGEILSISGERLAERLFRLYFDESAPFAARRDKKSEFPDAASLLLLEDYAESSATKGLVASGDDGWSKYAETSDRLYCVKSIDELASLFAATDEYAKSVKEKVLAAINDTSSPLRALLAEAFEAHVLASDWTVGDIYSGVVPRVEGEFYDASIVKYDLYSSLTNAWVVENDRTTWVVEVTASVTVEVVVSATFYVWDSIDREELELTSEHFSREVEVEVQAFISCAGVQAYTEPGEWSIEFEIASGSYGIDVGEVEPDMSD